MKLSTLKKKFKNEWVLAEVVKEDQLNRVVEVRPILHSKDRGQVYEALNRLKKVKHVATIYTGQLPPKGMVYSFHGYSTLSC